MKKFYVLLIIFILLLNTNVYASTNTKPRTEDNLDVWDNIDISRYKNDILNTPNVDETEKIYDFADLYTDSEELELYNKVTNYIEKTNVDLVILTIDQNNKGTAARYAEDFYIFNYFGMEDKKRSGSLFIIDMDTRTMELITSGSSILYIDDTRYDILLDKSFPYLKDENYYKATDVFIDNITDYGTTIPNSNENYTIDPEGNIVRKPRKPNFWKSFKGASVFGFIVANIIAIIFFFAEKSKYKQIIKAVSAGEYIDRNGIENVKSTDKFLSTYTSKTRIYHDSGSSGGGGGHAGSSTHIGGGGHSFGGGHGGRHF